MKRVALVLGTTLLLATPAWAACPPLATGDLPSAIQANQQRILCLQNEVSSAARQAQMQAQLRQLERNQQSFSLQRRFDALPAPGFPQTTWR